MLVCAEVSISDWTGKWNLRGSLFGLGANWGPCPKSKSFYSWCNFLCAFWFQHTISSQINVIFVGWLDEGSTAVAMSMRCLHWYHVITLKQGTVLWRWMQRMLLVILRLCIHVAITQSSKLPMYFLRQAQTPMWLPDMGLWHCMMLSWHRK